MMDMHSSIVRRSKSYPLFVTGLSISDRPRDIQQAWSIPQPMLIGLISGAALALCVTNLVTSLIDFSLATVIVLAAVHPQGLKLLDAEIVMQHLNSVSVQLAWSRFSTAVSLLKSSEALRAVEYHPFKAELATIMEVAEDFGGDDIHSIEEITNEERVMQIAQEAVVEVDEIIEYAEQYVDEEWIRYRCEEDAILTKQDYGRFSAQDYMDEIDDLYRQAFTDGPQIEEVVWH